MVWTRWVNISKVPPMISPIQQINVVKQCVTLVVTYDLWGFHIRGQRVQLVLFKCQVNKKILPWIDCATKLDPELLCELQNLLFCWTLYRNMFNNKTFFLWSPPSYWWSGLSSESSEWQENAHCLQGPGKPLRKNVCTCEALHRNCTAQIPFRIFDDENFLRSPPSYSSRWSSKWQENAHCTDLASLPGHRFAPALPARRCIAAALTLPFQYHQQCIINSEC